MHRSRASWWEAGQYGQILCRISNTDAGAPEAFKLSLFTVRTEAPQKLPEGELCSAAGLVSMLPPKVLSWGSKSV